MIRSAPGLALLAFVLLALGASATRAEQLPVRAFTSADGLAGELVQCLAEDPRGFLWIGTSTGLSRFDGYGFASFTTLEGLPDPSVQALLAARDGTLWVGTRRGVVRFREAAAGRSRFEPVPLGTAGAEEIGALAEDRDGTVWVGSAHGLYAIERSGVARRGVRTGAVQALLPTEDGLWVATTHGLRRLRPDGRIDVYSIWPDAQGWDVVRGLALDRGLLWLSHDRGIFAVRLPLPAMTGGTTLAALAGARSSAPRSVDDPAWQPPREPGRVAYRPALVPLPTGPRFTAVQTTADGGVWITTNGGLMRFDGSRWRQYGAGQGIADPTLSALHEDSAGNLWIGSETGGLLRMAGSRFLSYRADDGLTTGRVASVFEDRDGDLVVVAGGDGRQHLYVFTGERFEEVTPPILERLPRLSWGWNQLVTQDRHREWWLPTGQGLLRFPAGTARELRTATPLRFYTARDGLPGVDVFRTFEDSRGDLWLSLLDGPSPTVRWRRASDRFERMPDALPPHLVSAPTAFAEDRDGNVWIGFYKGGLVRWSEREGMRAFPPGVGMPEGFVHDLLLDRRGSVWVAATHGAARIDDPAGLAPSFVRYAAAGGLAHDSVRALGEDGQGRIYLGSARGLDRLEPATGRIESFTTGDGLASNILSVIARDRRGEMWLGTLAGLSRLRPGAARPAAPPRVFLSGVEIAGVPQETGRLASRLGGFELQPGGNRLQIELAGVSLAPGASLRYETRILGLAPEWSRPGTSRSVLLAGLPPGDYRFQARAVAGSGEASGEPAEVAFRVLPPLWRRGWFLAAVGLAAAAAAWGGHRYRLARLLALERMRTRIASDLHDEVGASLSRISILTEVGRLRLGDGQPEAGSLLGEIGDTSRELSEAMSDIVWALDPRKDDLPSLIARLRRFASDVLEAQGVALDFDAPPAGVDLHLASAERRELFLLVKEAVHNVARHARATRAEVRFAVAAGWLRVAVRDDGVGLPPALLAPAAASAGLGLTSMRQRAGLLGGSLEFESAPGAGTTVQLAVPLSAWKRARRSH